MFPTSSQYLAVGRTLTRCLSCSVLFCSVLVFDCLLALGLTVFEPDTEANTVEQATVAH